MVDQKTRVTSFVEEMKNRDKIILDLCGGTGSQRRNKDGETNL